MQTGYVYLLEPHTESNHLCADNIQSDAGVARLLDDGAHGLIRVDAFVTNRIDG